MRGVAVPRATIRVRHYRKGERDPVEFEVPAEIKHPWRPWQCWWWVRVLRRDLPWRGRIPRFRLHIMEAIKQWLLS